MYVVANDKALSGWGNAPGRSLVAVECVTDADQEQALAWFAKRPEMSRVRLNLALPRLREGDNLKVWRKGDAPMGMFKGEE